MSDGSLDLACALVERLAEQAIWWRDACTFVAASDPDSRGMRSGTCNGSLYDGTAGIARAIGHLGALEGSAAWIQLAYGCLVHAEMHVRTPGLYDGLAGVATTLVELGVLLDDEARVRRGVEIIRHCAAGVGSDWDLMCGTAGVLVALLGISEATGKRTLIDDAIDLADGWLRLARARPEGLSWKSPSHRVRVRVQDQDDCCGLAHGTSGCAMALELLGRSTGEQRWIEAGNAARRYERSGDNQGSGGWQDFRVEIRHSSWCWGAGGIGAERLAAAGGREDTGLIADAAAATRDLEAWLSMVNAGPRGPGRPPEANLSICHGMAGAADVLATAASQLNEPRFLDAARRLTSVASAYNSCGEIPSGLSSGSEVPGFMLGTAGLAYVLARLEALDTLPPATLPPLIHP